MRSSASYSVEQIIEDSPTSTGCDSRSVLIIGAGMSGILATIGLRARGFRNISVYEKAETLGGTWRDNTYPGLKCDVPAHMFTYSFAPNPDYSTRFPSGAEIRNYLQRVAEQYSVTQHIVFNKSIESLEFANGRWQVRDCSGRVEIFDIVICATGILHHPQFPEIPGRELFQGTSFHTSRWRHDIDLTGKRIGVIGSGATAVQIVPELVPVAGQLTLFQRTPQWIFPMPNKKYSSVEIERLRQSSKLATRLRYRYSKIFQYTFTRAVIGNRLLQWTIEAFCKSHLRRKVKDPALRQKLTPDFRAGCKRLIFGKGFYQALQQPSASLETAPIARIEPDGIRTDEGKLHKCDIIVYATGFKPHAYMRPMKVVGRHGRSLDAAWGDGVYAHRSTSIPGFPNFFMMFGPYSPIGNYSAISVAEVQVEYILKQLEQLTATGNDLIESRMEATTNLIRRMNRAMKKTIWMSGCQGWYINDHGQVPMWPWTFERYERELARIDPDEFILSKRNQNATCPQMSSVSLQLKDFESCEVAGESCFSRAA